MRSVVLLLAICLMSTLHSEAQPVRDYMFNVTGVVTDEDGSPLQGAEVYLEVDGQVYEGVNPVNAVKSNTNRTGGFVFAYTSHKRGVKYTLTVRKEGFESQTVSNQAPPPVHHTIRLRRAAGNDATPKPAAPALVGERFGAVAQPYRVACA